MPAPQCKFEIYLVLYTKLFCEVENYCWHLFTQKHGLDSFFAEQCLKLLGLRSGQCRIWMTESEAGLVSDSQKHFLLSSVRSSLNFGQSVPYLDDRVRSRIGFGQLEAFFAEQCPKLPELRTRQCRIWMTESEAGLVSDSQKLFLLSSVRS